MEGAGCVGGQEKEEDRVNGVFPGRPQSFRHQRRPVVTTAAAASQDEGEWRRTAEQGKRRNNS